MKLILKIMGGLLAASAAVAADFTQEQLKARFYYDLGPNTVDVTSCPQEQQENYKLFAVMCSQCHTLARPINSPMVSRADWKRFIARMHIKTKQMSENDFTAAQAKQILDFMVYDSQARKIAGKTAFDAQAAELKRLFGEVKIARARQQQESDQKKVRPYGDSTNATSRP